MQEGTVVDTRGLTDVAPSAARLTKSLRDIGYDFPAAVADLVDNSISAGADTVDIRLVFEPNYSYVLIADNGSGMTEAELTEALRFGSRRQYRQNELGRFGLGLKTGSFSQCGCLTVVTRNSLKQRSLRVRTLDLEFVSRTDSWVLTVDRNTEAVEHAKSLLANTTGTVVVWENLDRVLPDRFAESGWGRRRLTNLAAKTADHLAMVFHRHLAGSHGLRPVTMTITRSDADELTPLSQTRLDAWDPFASDEPATQSLPPEIFELANEDGTSDVVFRGYVLPPRDAFSKPEAFDRLSGPLRWNRQQGLYIYRANRLVQFGGWCGIRGIDEHTKLARASVDFDTDLDETFQINVAKMGIVLPATLRSMLERPIQDLCVRADAAYRQAPSAESPRVRKHQTPADNPAFRDIGVALKAAVLDVTGDADFRSTMKTLKARDPDLARLLGL